MTSQTSRNGAERRGGLYICIIRFLANFTNKTWWHDGQRKLFKRQKINIITEVITHSPFNENKSAQPCTLSIVLLLSKKNSARGQTGNQRQQKPEYTRAVLSPGNRAKPCKFRYVKSVRNFMWKLCYRKDDLAMRPIRGCPENFRTPWLRPRLLFPTGRPMPTC